MVERRTSQGKKLDMDALMAEYESTIAVGNAGSNARGDKLGRGGKVVATVQQVATAYYQDNPNAVITQSTKEEIGVTDQSTLKADTLDESKQAFDNWVDPEDSAETPTGKVTTEENKVVASGKAAQPKKAQPKTKSIDALYK